MVCAPSDENFEHQVESLQKELERSRRAVEVSQHNELKYRRLVENLSEGFMLLDRDRVEVGEHHDAPDDGLTDDTGHQ